MHRTHHARRIPCPRSNAGMTTMVFIETVIGFALLVAVVVAVVVALSTPWLLALLVMGALFLLLCVVIRDGLDFVLRLMSRF